MIDHLHLRRAVPLLALGLAGCGEGSIDPILTDPGQAPGTEVSTPSADFRDDFGSVDPGAWAVEQARTAVSEGVLELTNLNAGIAGRVNRDLETPIDSWEVRARLGRAQADSVVASVIFVTGHERYGLYALDVGSGVSVQGEETNYRLYVLDQTRPWPEENPWVALEGAYGVSDVVRDGAGEFTEAAATQRDGTVRVHAGDTELFAVALDSGYPTRMTGIGLWVFPLDGAADRTALFDWVEVSGTGTAGAASARVAGLTRALGAVPAVR